MQVTVLSGAGISAESGVPTFRDVETGLWAKVDPYEISSSEGWQANPERVWAWYLWRHYMMGSVAPNDGHRAVAAWQDFADVHVVTQNVDNLHERAGSKNVYHLHGSLFESRSTKDEGLVYPIKGWELKMGDLCEKGSQLRPNIVWFGEMVPLIEVSADHASQADIFLVVGTSLQVYPAAGLLHYVRYDVPKYVIDPKLPEMQQIPLLTMYAEKASSGMEKVKKVLLEMF